MLIGALIGALTYNRYSQRRPPKPSQRYGTPEIAKLATFKLPPWANTIETKQLAHIIHIFPLLRILTQHGLESESISPRYIPASSLPRSLFPSLDSNATTVDVFELLRQLCGKDGVRNVLSDEIDPAILVRPLIDMVCSPSVSPYVHKYAASCLNRLCQEKDGRLCKLIAIQAHSYDLLVALSQYSDFRAWNYLYLLQHEPALVEHAERLNRQADEGIVPPANIPAHMRPFHRQHEHEREHGDDHHSSTDSHHSDLNDDVLMTTNRNTSPVSTFLSHHLAGSPASLTPHIFHPHSSHSRDLQTLIDLILSLPPVHSSSPNSPVQSVFERAISTGTAQRELGSGLVTMAREVGKGVVQQGQALAASFRSSLADDDLALLRAHTAAVNGQTMTARIEAALPDTLTEQVRNIATEARRHTTTLLHTLLSRRPGYKLGHASALDRREARKQEVSYHLIRAMGTLSQDATTAAQIVDAGGIELLYRVYQQSPHELRVQLQVARTLANLLEHAHKPPADSPPIEPTQADQRYATYHAVAQSGFLPLLVHWQHHALDYTDADANTASKKKHKKKSPRHPKHPEPSGTTPSPHHPTILKSDDPAAPLAVDPSHPSKVVLSTQPTDPTVRHLQADHLARVTDVGEKHRHDEMPTQPIPPPTVHAPSEMAAIVDKAKSLVPPPASSSPPSTPSASHGVLHVNDDPHPLRQPHHPESAASLRNKLQLQSARALLNMQSILSYKYLADPAHEDERALWIERHGDTINFPLFADEVYQFYPISDTLQPISPELAKMTIAQRHSHQTAKTLTHHLASAASSTLPPTPPPTIEYDIVFLHGLMGNALRTWRLHSMHDRTIGWIPSTPEEKRRAGLKMKGHPPSSSRSDKLATGDPAAKLTPLELHLSNLVASAPVPVDTEAKSSSLARQLDPTRLADRTSIWGDHHSHTHDDPHDANDTELDGGASPSSSSSSATAALPPHAPVYISHHSLDFETLWPRDWLPTAFPNARVLSLGYHTGLSMKSTGEMHSKNLDERAREMVKKMELAGIGQNGRKIIWVTHRSEKRTPSQSVTLTVFVARL